MKKIVTAFCAATLSLATPVVFAQASGAMSSDTMAHDSMDKSAMTSDAMASSKMSHHKKSHKKMAKPAAMGMDHDASGAMAQ